jgi:glycosyltransferase involved in cell wall biosynthesis
MHIAINCRSFSKKEFTGIGRYASSLVNALAEIDTANRYSLYTSRGFSRIKRTFPLARARNFSVRCDWLRRGPWKTLKSVDVYHAPSPEVINGAAAKVVVTVHDLIYKTYPQGHTPQTLRLTERQFASFIPKAAKIICSSQSTLNDLRAYFSVEQSRACYIHQGVDKNIFYPIEERQMRIAQEAVRLKGVEGPFLLFVGTIEPRKNLQGALKAFAWLKQKRIFKGKLAVIGMPGWKSEGLSALIDQLGIRPDVVFVGFVTNDELRAFYNLAEVFVFPSFYEGFGYPILEAFSCKAAVVASNVSSCPELAGDAALTVDPNSPEDIARAVARILGDEALKSSLREKALQRASAFDNLKMARATLKVYEEVCQD